MTLPLTTADWACTEGRFEKHFRPFRDDVDGDPILFHELLELAPDERKGHVPFVYVLDEDKHLARLEVSEEIVALSEERLLFWSQLRQLAGHEVHDGVRATVEAELDATFDEKAEAIRAEYEGRIAELKAHYPGIVARRMAEGLLRSGDGNRTIAGILGEAQTMEGLAPIDIKPLSAASGDGGTPAPAATNGSADAASAAPVAVADAPEAVEEEEEEEDYGDGAYIESARCTACNECTDLNGLIFAYNDKKLAYIKDASAGPYKDIVTAAERCPVEIIHPGAPLNLKEKNVDKWIARAEPFNG